MDTINLPYLLLNTRLFIIEEIQTEEHELCLTLESTVVQGTCPKCDQESWGVVISDWMQANDIQATALQCWTSLQKSYGVNACTLMSNQLMPSACETDITGVVSMYALQLASDSPGALVDWNKNYNDDPGSCVLFHCGNRAKTFIPDI
ncbi:MAG: hypothetical protein QY332_16480 [Anaerolineales bacterium]|nr:MAG: hypothetical protein QY332_16480 [Anaerolineales bacterium]